MTQIHKMTDEQLETLAEDLNRSIHTADTDDIYDRLSARLERVEREIEDRAEQAEEDRLSGRRDDSPSLAMPSYAL